MLNPEYETALRIFCAMIESGAPKNIDTIENSITLGLQFGNAYSKSYKAR